MYNVKITVENLKVLNDRCTGKFKIFKNIMIMNMIVYPYKRIGKYPHTSRFETVKNRP